MASLSVKDRAKMFGNLASPDDVGKDRSNRRALNNKTSAPFGSSPSPKRASLPEIKVSPSPFSLKVQDASIKITETAANPNKEEQHVSSKSQNSTSKEKGSLNWPDEEGIPAPTARKIENNSQKVTAKCLSPKSLPVSSSPFKNLNNKDTQGRLPNYNSNKSKKGSNFSPFKTLTVEAKSQYSDSPQKTPAVNQYVTKIENMERKGSESEENEEENFATTINTSIEPNYLSQDSAISNDNEDNLPSTGNARNKSTRAMRLMKARRTTQSLVVSKNLTHSLQAGKVDLEEEKSDFGKPDTSCSSFTNKDLGNVVTKGLKKSKDGMQQGNIEKYQKLNETSLSTVRNSELRQVLLNVTASRSRRMTSATSERLGVKASRAVAMKNSNKTKVAENSRNSVNIVKTRSTNSNDSGRNRRMEHPAFAGRPLKSNISSTHLLTSFQKFNATRQCKYCQKL